MDIINKAAIESLMGPLAEGDIKVSLFIVSSKSPHLKKLNLDNLSTEERTRKLHKWGQAYRFVAVIELGDMIFAHTYAKHAEKLQALEDLSLNGKKVAVKALTEEESQQLSAIGEAFEEHVLISSEEESKETEEESNQQSQANSGYVSYQYLARDRLMHPQLQTYFLIEHMVKRSLGKILSDCMQKYLEAQRELQKQKEADEKYYRIKQQEIKREILNSEIKQGEVKKQARNHQILNEDGKRLYHIRGIEI